MHKTAERFPLDEFYSGIYGRYDLMNRLFTFGMDGRWRRDTALKCMEFGPEKVLDLCCGTGDLSTALYRASGGSAAITCFDRNASMLGIAGEKAAGMGARGMEFVRGDADSMPFADSHFDCLTIGFGLRNLLYENDSAPACLREMHRVLKPGGHLLALESSVPVDPFVRFFFTLYLKACLVPLGWLLTGKWKAYEYLVRSTLGFYDAAALEDLLGDYGFTSVSVRKYFLGAANLIVAEKR